MKINYCISTMTYTLKLLVKLKTKFILITNEKDILIGYHSWQQCLIIREKWSYTVFRIHLPS